MGGGELPPLTWATRGAELVVGAPDALRQAGPELDVRADPGVELMQADGVVRVVALERRRPRPHVHAAREQASHGAEGCRLRRRRQIVPC